MIDFIKNDADEWVANPSKRLKLLLASTVTTSSTSRQSVSGWSFTAEAGKSYLLRVVGIYKADTASEQMKFGFLAASGGAGTAAGVVHSSYEESSVIKDAVFAVSSLTDDDSTTHFSEHPSVANANQIYALTAQVAYTCTTGSTVTAIWKTKNGGVVSLLAGSVLIIEEL